MTEIPAPVPAASLAAEEASPVTVVPSKVPKAAEATPEADKSAANRTVVANIISNRFDMIYEDFDRLHRRGIHDQDIYTALEQMGEAEILDGYRMWMEDGE